MAEAFRSQSAWSCKKDLKSAITAPNQAWEEGTFKSMEYFTGLSWLSQRYLFFFILLLVKKKLFGSSCL